MLHFSCYVYNAEETSWLEIFPLPFSLTNFHKERIHTSSKTQVYHLYNIRQNVSSVGNSAALYTIYLYVTQVKAFLRYLLELTIYDECPILFGSDRQTHPSRRTQFKSVRTRRDRTMRLCV